MNREQAEKLWALWLERKLGVQEERMLVAALQSDAELRVAFLGDAELDGVLRARQAACGDAVRFVEEVTKRRWAQNHGGAFLSALQERLDRAPTQRPPRSRWRRPWRMSTRVVLALTMLAVALGWRLVEMRSEPALAGIVLSIEGSASAARGPSQATLHAGDSIKPGDLIITSAEGRMRVRSSDAGMIELGPASTLKLGVAPAPGIPLVGLKSGVGMFQKGAHSNKQSWIIEAGALRAKFDGAKLSARVQTGGSSCKVEAGQAAVEAIDSHDRAIVREGESASVGPDGGLRLAMTLRPRSAEDFRESVGICTHLEYWDTPYARFNEIVKPRLAELGIRHIRDGILNQVDSIGGEMRKLSKLGMRVNLILSPKYHPPETALALITALGPVVESIEPSPTPDRNTAVGYKGEGFPDWAADYQHELYATLRRAGAGIERKPILAPSLGEFGNAEQLRLIGQADLANAEWFPQFGEAPESLPDGVLAAAQSVAGPGKSVIISAEGWPTPSKSGEADKKGSAISEAAAAAYLVRMLLDNFRRKVSRTYLYELLDVYPETAGRYDREAHFGLLQHDGAPKPAFYAIRNLLRIAGSEGAPSVLKPLEVELSGNLERLEYLCLQRTDGGRCLFVWRKERSDDNSMAAREIRIRLGESFRSIARLDFTEENMREQALAPGSEVSLKVGDAPVALRLTQ